MVSKHDLLICLCSFYSGKKETKGKIRSTREIGETDSQKGKEKEKTFFQKFECEMSGKRGLKSNSKTKKISTHKEDTY